MKRVIHLAIIVLSATIGWEVGLYLRRKMEAYLAEKTLSFETGVYLESVSQS